MSFAQGLEQSWYRSAWKNAYWLPLWLLVALVVFLKDSSIYSAEKNQCRTCRSGGQHQCRRYG